MGANLGTCFTNGLIALTLSNNPNEFKRAISSAVFNDMFNLLTISVLLPIEISTHFLYHISQMLTNLMPFDNCATISSFNFVKIILDPIINKLILLDAEAVNRVANGGNDTIIALRCFNESVVNNSTYLQRGDKYDLSANRSQENLTTEYTPDCHYLCYSMVRTIGDGLTGLIFIILSLLILTICLFGIVKVLTYLITGPIAKGIRKSVNASFNGRLKILSDIIIFIVAILITVLVQSSNIVTATLIPLCGIGIVTLERVYLLTLGSNIGTTITGVLTAFASPPLSMKKSMQLAFVYSLFNIVGVLLWLPIPKLQLPKCFAYKLGETIYKYRWFLFVYISCLYFILPLTLFGIALIPHWIGLAVVGIPLIVLILIIVIYQTILHFNADLLPLKYRDTNWIPLYLRSLEPMDKRIKELIAKIKPSQQQLVEAQQQQPIISREQPNVQEEGGFNSFIRRFSVVESLVEEARNYSLERSTSMNDLNDDPDNQA